MRALEVREARSSGVETESSRIGIFIFDAPSSRNEARVAQRAELDPFRVVEAVSFGKEDQ